MEKTAPLIDFYKAKGNLITVKGQEKVEDTSALVLEQLKK
jgi:adenylate kinase family enzyme